MNTPSNDPSPKPETSPDLTAQDSKPESPPLTDEALAAQQEQYRQAYFLQLRRMSCPGCGDDGIILS